MTEEKIKLMIATFLIHRVLFDRLLLNPTTSISTQISGDDIR